jgi:hypothetical protein
MEKILAEYFKEELKGILSCYDRVVLSLGKPHRI